MHLLRNNNTHRKGKIYEIRKIFLNDVLLNNRIDRPKDVKESFNDSTKIKKLNGIEEHYPKSICDIASTGFQ